MRVSLDIGATGSERSDRARPGFVDELREAKLCGFASALKELLRQQFVGRSRVLAVIKGVGRTDRSLASKSQQRDVWSAAARKGAEDAVLRILRRRYPGRRVVAHWNESDALGQVSPPGLDLDRREDAA